MCHHESDGAVKKLLTHPSVLVPNVLGARAEWVDVVLLCLLIYLCTVKGDTPTHNSFQWRIDIGNVHRSREAARFLGQ